MNINAKAVEFSNLIRDTREFKELMKAKADLRRIPRIAAEVKKFQHEQRKLERQGDENVEEEVYKKMSETFHQLNKTPEVQHYMEAVMRLNHIVFAINQSIFEELDEDIMI